MYKSYISIKKEFLLLFNDKVGLALMFVMPLLLVFIITIIQNSAFKIVNNNSITLLVSNHDKGDLGSKLTSLLTHSGLFDITENATLDSINIKGQVVKKHTLTALYLSPDFTEKLTKKSKTITNNIMSDFGIAERNKNQLITLPTIQLYHDPVLQENYCFSIENVIYAHLNVIENSIMLENIYHEMGIDSVPQTLKSTFINNQLKIERINALKNKVSMVPNATQHNVPAWTIFAMFFMVVSLGTNIVKERNSGSFIRLKTMPNNFFLVLLSKEIVYITVAFLQVTLIFSIGIYIFPYLNLPKLSMPDNIPGTITIILICAFTAVSYALMIGSLASTQEQANGIGAISIIIFAALGGVWVPSFVMPEYMQVISMFSPLHWCIEGFYVLFLKNGNWSDLINIILILLLFSTMCQIITFGKLKIEKIV